MAAACWILPAAAAAAAGLQVADLDDASLAAFSTFLDMDGPGDSSDFVRAVPGSFTPGAAFPLLLVMQMRGLSDLSVAGQHLRGHIGPGRVASLLPE